MEKIKEKVFCIKSKKKGSYNMKKMKEKVFCIVMLTYFFVCNMTINVLAGEPEATTGFKDTKLYTGTTKLINDASTAALGIEAAVVALLEIIEGIKYQMADDQEKPRHVKSMKSTLFIGILIMCVTGLVKVVFGYYN